MGVGVDVMEIDRFAASLARRPRLAERCFTPAEAAYCASRAFPPQHFAARFAAKEAVGKALGIGMTRWREVEVVRGRGRAHDRPPRPLRPSAPRTSAWSGSTSRSPTGATRPSPSPIAEAAGR